MQLISGWAASRSCGESVCSVIVLLFLLFLDGILWFGSVCVMCSRKSCWHCRVKQNKKKFSRYDAARDSRCASVYTHAHRTTLNVEQTAVMVVQFDFLIIIRLLSLTSPFRFDNSWKRLSSSQSYQPLRVPHTSPFTHELKAVTFYINVHYKNTSGIGSCIYIYIIIYTSWQVACVLYV